MQSNFLDGCNEHVHIEHMHNEHIHTEEEIVEVDHEASSLMTTCSVSDLSGIYTETAVLQITLVGYFSHINR